MVQTDWVDKMAGKLMNVDENEFQKFYNSKPFLLTHRLTDHPLLQLDQLEQLAHRLGPQSVLHRVGKVESNTNFDRCHLNHPHTQSLSESFADMNRANTVITINTPENDEVYRPLIEEITDEIKAYSEPIDPGLNWYASYIFISSPGTLTPYHMDREMNFLFQLKGNKRALLWDPCDHDVMQPEEVDQLLGDWGKTRPQYRPELDQKAMTFTLKPGDVVHHPFIAPHLIHCGDEFSISLAVTFRTKGSDRLTRLHKVNYQLRKLGFRPHPIGASKIRDRAKYLTLGNFRHLAERLKP